VSAKIGASAPAPCWASLLSCMEPPSAHWFFGVARV
jgi:hypothetical protein